MEKFVEISKNTIFQWEQDEMHEDDQPALKQAVTDEREFGGENIQIPGEAISAAFRKQKLEEESDEEEKAEVNSNNGSNMAVEKEEVPSHLEIATASGIPWMTSRTDVNDPWVQLHNEMVEFYRLFGPTKEQNVIRKNFFLKVKKVIKKVFPNSVVKMFGSTAAMLYLPKSDIDVVVFLPKQISNDFKNAKKLHKLMSQISWVKFCECIGAKVPIVKLEDKETALFMDISFSRANGVAALSFIKKYLILYPELKYLLVIIKAFLKTRDLNETFHGGMSSFVLTLLIISYLQESRKDPKNEASLLSEHLINFFHLYGVRFNYNELGISIRNGGTYFLREGRDWLAMNRNKSVTLCVENPQDPTIDLGKAVFNMPQIHTAFQHAYDTLRFNSSKSESLLECIMGDISNLR